VRHGDVAAMHRIFAAHMQGAEAQADLARAAAIAREAPACLLCFERDPAQCHRSIVAGMLSIPTVHLTPQATHPQISQINADGEATS